MTILIPHWTQGSPKLFQVILTSCTQSGFVLNTQTWFISGWTAAAGPALETYLLVSEWVSKWVSEWMRRPNFRIGQTVITLSSLFVALSKLFHARDHYVTVLRFVTIFWDSASTFENYLCVCDLQICRWFFFSSSWKTRREGVHQCRLMAGITLRRVALGAAAPSEVGNAWRSHLSAEDGWNFQKVSFRIFSKGQQHS